SGIATISMPSGTAITRAIANPDRTTSIVGHAASVSISRLVHSRSITDPGLGRMYGAGENRATTSAQTTMVNIRDRIVQLARFIRSPRPLARDSARVVVWSGFVPGVVVVMTAPPAP